MSNDNKIVQFPSKKTNHSDDLSIIQQSGRYAIKVVNHDYSFATVRLIESELEFNLPELPSGVLNWYPVSKTNIFLALVMHVGTSIIAIYQQYPTLPEIEIYQLAIESIREGY